MTIMDRGSQILPAWQDNMPVTSRYTLGLAGERFFRAIKDEGRILGTYCSKCDRTYVPAASFCERCMNKLEEWVDVGTTGEVHTYTLLYQNYDGSPRQEPEIIVFVRLGDGGLIHRLGNIDPEAIEIGMKVKAVFNALSQRKGSILDISHFEPVDK